MKNSIWIMVLIVVAIIAFLVGYSVAPRNIDTGTGPSVAPGHAGGYGAQAGGYGGSAASGGYGAPSAGGYGAPAGGYGAPPAGGYGAPPAGGYGSPSH